MNRAGQTTLLWVIVLAFFAIFAIIPRETESSSNTQQAVMTGTSVSEPGHFPFLTGNGLGNQSLSFIPNHGLARTPALPHREPPAFENDGGEDLLQFTSGGHVLGFGSDSVYVAGLDRVLRVEHVGGRPVQPVAEGAGTSSDNSATLGRVTYAKVWDGVDVVYRAAKNGILESFYYLEDAEETSGIRLRYNRPVSLDGQGNLVAAFENGNMVESAPVAWQEVDGEKRFVDAAYVLHGEHEVGFALGDYLPGVPVVIDPVLSWKTFLGSGGPDNGFGIAVDGSGYVYVTGNSRISWGTPIREHSGEVDAFVAKLNGSTGTLVWNTFLGSSSLDYGHGIAVDGIGNPYVIGSSYKSWGTPVRPQSGKSVFVAKLNGITGTVMWNTFLGSGGDSDHGTDIVVDSNGNVFVTGYSGISWGTPIREHSGGLYWDAFVAKLNGSTGALVWNTFLGSTSNVDYGNDIALDNSGNLCVIGSSWGSWGTPVRAHSGGDVPRFDAFVAKLHPGTGVLIWNTFLGGSCVDEGEGIAIDGSGNVYVTGSSYACVLQGSSPPTCNWGLPVQGHTEKYSDAFAAKLNSNGALVWNTFLGGSGLDYGKGIAVDGSGKVYVMGIADTYHGWGTMLSNGWTVDDTFIAELNGSNGARVGFVFLGQSPPPPPFSLIYKFFDISGEDIAVDGGGKVYVTGSSISDSTWGWGNWGNPVRAHSGDGDLDAFVAGGVSVTAHNVLPGVLLLLLDKTVPDAPTLIAPANGAKGVPRPSVTFHWDAVSGATRYLLSVQALTGPDAANGWAVDAGNVTSFAVEFNYKEVTYGWTVRAGNSRGWGGWSSTWTFTTD